MTSEQRPPVYNGHSFVVPRVVVAHRFDCIWQIVYRSGKWQTKTLKQTNILSTGIFFFGAKSLVKSINCLLLSFSPTQNHCPLSSFNFPFEKSEIEFNNRWRFFVVYKFLFIFYEIHFRWSLLRITEKQTLLNLKEITHKQNIRF